MWLLTLLLACSESDVPCQSPLGNADADCDGLDDRDGDGDGAVSAALGGDDCDDADPLLNPADADGDGTSTCGGDCDDDRADIGARGVTPETCDNVDNDCNGIVDVDDLGAPACLVIEKFGQPKRLQLDLLVVVDDTGSMLDEEGRLAAAGDALFTWLDGTDTHVGVITNNVEDMTVAGRLHPPIGGGDRFLRVLEDSPEETRIWWRGATAVGADAQHADAGFDAAYLALDANADTFNAGFYRTNAELAVWFISDSNDDSTVLSQAEFADFLSNLKIASDGSARVDGIVPLTGDDCTVVNPYSGSFEALALDTGGIAESVCELEWSTAADAIGALEAPVTQIVEALAQTPIPATLAAELTLVDGGIVPLAVDALIYDPFGNTVTAPGWVWTEVVSVLISYEVLPP